MGRRQFLGRALRRHWLFAALLVLGTAVRVVVQVAYYPALIFPDSVRYLEYAQSFADGRWSVDALRQSGYSILIIPALLAHAMWLIPLVQHLVGLATVGLVYAVLVRYRTWPWLAAMAAIPVLFDPLQLDLEQYVLTDTWTVFLLVAALVILVWPGPGAGPASAVPSWRRVAACGLLLGAAVTFRDEELIMIVPAALYLLVVVRPGRLMARRLGALTGCFLIPVGAYLGWFEASHHQFGFSTFTGTFLYSRVVDFASCQGLTLPGYERPLCPDQPPDQRDANNYTWNPTSPQWTFTVPAGMSREAVVQNFSERILEHQPLAYLEAAGHDFAYGFSAVRGPGPEGYSPAYLKFQTYVRPDNDAYASIRALGYPVPRLRKGPAAFMTGYGAWFYVPGPVLAAGLLLGVAGVAAGRRRRGAGESAAAGAGGSESAGWGGNWGACLLFTAGAIAVLIPPAAFAFFDWRYQLPQLTLIPVAAICGFNTIASRLTRSSQPGPSDSGASMKAERPA